MKPHKDILKAEIEAIRKEMLLIGREQGLTAPQTVKASTTLDEKIILYQTYFSRGSE